LQEQVGSSFLLVYTESGSKNNSGESKLQNKSVKLFENESDERNYAVRMYKKCMAHRRPKYAPIDVFYLQPACKVTSDAWYQARPIGHNTLARIVNKLCLEIGQTGHYTNHLLRKTAVTRMFQKGVEEDRIMSITGHRSAKALRVYIQPKKMKSSEAQDCQIDKQNTCIPAFNCTVTLNYK
jgi:site-specific recombinase XerD